MSSSPTIDTTEAAAPAQLTNCPACGSHVLFTVDLEYGGAEGFRPDYFGVTPKQGDTISRCDNCGSFFVHPVTVNGDTLAAPTASESTNVVISPTSTSGPDVAAIEQLMLAKLGELEQTLGAKVSELEQRLAAEQDARAATQQELAAATTPPTTPEPPAEGSAAPPAAAETPSVALPETAATPDTPTEGGPDGTPEGA